MKTVDESHQGETASCSSQLVSEHTEIPCSSWKVRDEKTLQSSYRSDAPHMQISYKCQDTSKNGDCKTSSQPFILPHVYDTWHREKRGNIKCMEKSIWLRKDISTEVMLPRVERNSGPWCERQ